MLRKKLWLVVLALAVGSGCADSYPSTPDERPDMGSVQPSSPPPVVKVNDVTSRAEIVIESDTSPSGGRMFQWNIHAGPSKPLRIRITNTGKVPAVYTLPVSSSPEFQVGIHEFAPFGPPGESTVFDVSFDPDQEGVRDGSVYFSYRALQGGESYKFIINLRGEGTNRTVYASPTGDDMNPGSSTAPVKTIQRALQIVEDNGGRFDTILLRKGVYAEQLLLTSDVTIAGEGALGDAVINAPSALVENPVGTKSSDLVVFAGPRSQIHLYNLTISGPGPAGYFMNAGIRLRDNAAVYAERLWVRDIHDHTFNGATQTGIGIHVGGRITNDPNDPMIPFTSGALTLHNSRIERYQKGGIVAQGPGTLLTVSDSRVVGVGRTDQIAQNGIQVTQGARALLTRVEVEGNLCDVATCGPDKQWLSTGIIANAATGDLIQIRDCRVKDSDYGIYGASVNLSDPGPIGSISVSGTDASGRYYAMVQWAGKLDLSRNSFHDSPKGLTVWGNSTATFPDITGLGNTFTGNRVGIEVGADIMKLQPRISLTQGEIQRNDVAVDVANEIRSGIDLRLTWWGSDKGAQQMGFNRVKGNVNTLPFLQSPLERAPTLLARQTPSGSLPRLVQAGPPRAQPQLVD